MRCLIALVHEVLERHIPSFLEFHVIFECIGNYLVHFVFEHQQLCSKFQWIFKVFLILYYLPTFFHDEWGHLVNDVFEGRFDTREDLIHFFQLLYFPIVKHILTTRWLESKCFCLIINSFFEDDVDDSLLGLLLQKIIGVSLLFLQMLSNFLHVIRTAEGISPKLRALSVKVSRSFLKILFELRIILFEILLSKPLNSMRALWLLDLCEFIKSHIQKLLNSLFDQVFIYKFIISILLNL